MKSLYVVASIVLCFSVFAESEFFDTPAYIGAHRGGGDLWPESTVEAYKECIAAYPTVVLEADVHMTKDGHVVVMHDKTVDRTSDGTGAVADFTLEELKALDAGYKFTKDGGETFPYRGKGLKFLTLEEALALAPENRWVVETKDGTNITEKTLDVIRKSGMESKILLASFVPTHMTYFRQEAPEIARCFDFETAARLLAAMRGGDWDAYEPEAHCVSLMKRMVQQTGITSEEIAKLEAKGIYSQIHTPNIREEMDEYLAFGFHSILTDRPDLLAEAVEAFQAKK